jgi:hypothetical protein
MSWTMQVTYVAAAWSAAQTAALVKMLGQAEIAYDDGGNLLQITVAVEAANLEEAASRGLRVGVPMMFRCLPTALRAATRYESRARRRPRLAKSAAQQPLRDPSGPPCH